MPTGSVYNLSSSSCDSMMSPALCRQVASIISPPPAMIGMMSPTLCRQMVSIISPPSAMVGMMSLVLCPQIVFIISSPPAMIGMMSPALCRQVVSIISPPSAVTVRCHWLYANRWCACRSISRRLALSLCPQTVPVFVCRRSR